MYKDRKKPLGAEVSLELIASKDIEPSILQPHGTEFSQQLNEEGNLQFPRASRKECSPPHLDFSPGRPILNL